MPLPIDAVLLRMGAAVLTGLILGLERESRGRPAGLRTTTLVCVAAAMAAMLSEFWYAGASTTGVDWRPDPARLAAGVLTGMGFLGAGTILRQGNLVRGLTTAAVLWYVTILGLAYGSGYIFLGLIGLGVALIVVLTLPWFDRLIGVERFASLSLTTTLNDETPSEDIRREIEGFGVRVLHIELEHDLQLQQRTLKFDLEFKQRRAGEISQRLVGHLTHRPCVLRVKWE